MELIEIILIILGVLVMIVSFLVPAGKGKNTEDQGKVSEETIRKLVDQEVESAKSQIGDIVDETITYSMEKTERAMERLSNEKIMVMNEYSDTVLGQINKNHQEAVFLYDMLNDKQESLKAAVSQASKTVSEVKRTAQDAEVTARQVAAELEAQKEDKPPKRSGTQNAGEPSGGFFSEMQSEVSEIQDISYAQEESQQEFQSEQESFMSLTPPRAVVIARPAVEEDEAEQEEESARKRAQRKPREIDSGADMLMEAELLQNSAEVPEIAVSLNTEGKAGRNSNDQILELHKAGKSNIAIAKELGLGIGEVKLVIDLFEGL